MMPHLAARSTSENVAGASLLAPLASFWSRRRRMSRIWCRNCDFLLRLIAVRRAATRTRFSEDTVFAINLLTQSCKVTISGYIKRLSHAAGGAGNSFMYQRALLDTFSMKVGRMHFLFRVSLTLVALGMGAWAINAPVSDWVIAGPFGGTATTVTVDPKTDGVVLAGGRNSLL